MEVISSSEEVRFLDHWSDSDGLFRYTVVKGSMAQLPKGCDFQGAMINQD